MSYKIGSCPMCNATIMVRDSRGQWNSYKPSFRQADMVFKDGGKMRTVICEECLSKPDLEKLFHAIIANDSEACTGSVKDMIKEKGIPVSIVLAQGVKQGSRLGG